MSSFKIDKSAWTIPVGQAWGGVVREDQSDPRRQSVQEGNTGNILAVKSGRDIVKGSAESRRVGGMQCFGHRGLRAVAYHERGP